MRKTITTLFVRALGTQIRFTPQGPEAEIEAFGPTIGAGYGLAGAAQYRDGAGRTLIAFLPPFERDEGWGADREAAWRKAILDALVQLYDFGSQPGYYVTFMDWGTPEAWEYRGEYPALYGRIAR